MELLDYSERPRSRVAEVLLYDHCSTKLSYLTEQVDIFLFGLPLSKGVRGQGQGVREE